MAESTIIGGNVAQVLIAFVQRVERIEDEIRDLNDDKKEVYAEAKAYGLDVKTLKKVIQRRRMDDDAKSEQDFMLEAYEDAINGVNEDVNQGPEGFKVKHHTSKELYSMAVELVKANKRCSVSYVQRCLGVGYNQAANLVDKLEEAGWVSAPDKAGKRQVFVDMPVKKSDGPDPSETLDPDFLDK